MTRIPYISITLGQQGGLGWPPCIIFWRGRWWAVADSRDKRPPTIVDEVLEHCRALRPRHPKWHTQGWALRKLNSAPQTTWAEVEAWIKRRRNLFSENA